MIISEKISKTIKVLNEDLVYTGDNYAYVLDGATSLGKKLMVQMMQIGMLELFHHI